MLDNISFELYVHPITLFVIYRTLFLSSIMIFSRNSLAS